MYSVELVQKIRPGNISGEIIGYGSIDYVVDIDSNELYSLAYYKSNGSTISGTNGNKEMICKFPLPSISDGEEILLNEKDLLDCYSFEDHLTIAKINVIVEGKYMLLAAMMTSRYGQKYGY